MSKRPGIIYDLGEGRYGLAYNDEQRPGFKEYNKVYLHVFLDQELNCTIPERDPKNNKKYVTLKHISKIKPIGFAD